MGPLKVMVAPLPTDDGVMLPEMEKVIEELELWETTPAHPQRTKKSVRAGSNGECLA